MKGFSVLLFLLLSCGYGLETTFLQGGPTTGTRTINWASGWFTGGTQTTTGANVNSASAPIEWSTSSFHSSYFSHSTSTESNKITITQDGNYFAALTIPLISTVERSTIRSQIRINEAVGSFIAGTTSESSYARNDPAAADDHDSTSNHSAFVLANLSAGDTIEVMVEQGSIAGTVTIGGDQPGITEEASLYLEYIAPERKVFSALTDTTDGGSNFNSDTPNNLEWTPQLSTSTYSHSASINPHRVTVQEDGDYFITANLPLAGTLARGNVNMIVNINGVPRNGFEAKQGYIRNSGGNNTTSSIHLSGLLTNLTAGNVITLTTEREAIDGSLTIQDPGNDFGSLFIEKIETQEPVFHAYASQLRNSGIDWNPINPERILWETVDRTHSQTYSHSTSSSPEEITFLRDGDYLVVYRDSLTSLGERNAPLIRLNINGAGIPGAMNATHYMRGLDDHDESSGTIVFFLENTSAGDTLTITAQQETSGLNPPASVEADGEATLMIWDRTRP
jgi:hypothetical protein